MTDRPELVLTDGPGPRDEHKRPDPAGPTGLVGPGATPVRPDRWYTYRCPMRWSDMDLFGHVNNARYLTYLEQARVGFMDALVAAGSTPLLERGVLVSHHEIVYLNQLVYREAPVPIDVWVTKIGGASFEVSYEVYDEAAAGETTAGETSVGETSVGETSVGETSVDGVTAQEARPVGDQLTVRTPYARARTTIVSYDPRHKRVRRLTPDQRTALEGYLALP